jgi:hypothetical protein
MKKHVSDAALSALLLVFAFVPAGCDETLLDSNTVDFKLRGTWESTATDPYSGKLIIGYDTIKIIGYNQSKTPWLGDDNDRPFKDFAKNAPLGCYTEGEKLFITTATGTKSVPYLYSTHGGDKYLLFHFGGRDEALKRTGY